MAASDSVLAIDIGGDSLKIAEFSYPAEGGIILEKFAVSEYGGEVKEEDLLNNLADTLRNAIIENGFKARKVNISVSGQSAFVRFVKLPPIGEEEAKVKQIVEFEAKQNVPFPIDEVVWDYQLISSADESEIEVMFVVVKNDFIEQITKIIEDIGKEVIIIEVAPTACYNSARANHIGDKDCEIILNIGGRCSTLVFIDGGRFFVRTIPIAGHSITQQISKEFGIPYPDAEEMKRRHGFVALGGAYEEPDSEVAATVSKIVRNVMTRLHGEINRSINVYRSQQKGRKPEKLYLAGGSSVMAFTPRFFSEKLRIPVDYFNPFQIVSLAPTINKEELAEVAHMFSESIGLGLRKATNCPIEISLVPDALKKQNEIKQKIPYFYFSLITLVLCLGLTYLAFSNLYEMASKKDKFAQEAVTTTQSMLSQVNKVKGELSSIESEYNEAAKLLDERRKWIPLLNLVQDQIPENTWIAKFKGSGKASAGAAQAADQPKAAFGGFFPFGGGGGPKKSSGPVAAGTIEWIQLDGHSLVDKQNSNSEEILRSKLFKSGFFSENKEEVNTVFFTPAKGNNNITTFTMEAKLKNPIRK